MPSNYTEHFGLSQWERADKVQMEDFNADNARIDAALACHPSGELIADVTVEEEVPKLELDISQLDWSRYFMLILIVDAIEPRGFSVSIGSSHETNIHLYTSASTLYSASHLITTPYLKHLAVLFPVLYDGSHHPTTISFGHGSEVKNFESKSYASLAAGGGEGTLSTRKAISVNRHSGLFSVGDRAVLWGIK